MDSYLDRLDSLFSEFVSRISHFEPISDFPTKFKVVDRELVSQVEELRKHYAACKRIEELRDEGASLDNKVNSILIELAQFREELESSPSVPSSKEFLTVNSQDLLDYSSKITRFTKQLPGSAEVGILPWPAEDQLRRGMLATLTLQEESMASESPSVVEEQHATQEPSATPEQAQPPASAPPAGERPKPAAAKPKPKPKISLDLDSDEDD